MPPLKPALGRTLALLLCLLPAIARAGSAPLPAVTDTLAQRVAACTVCHGQEGRATNLGYFPRIAGKPAGYLYNQLINFREGRRDYPLMSYLVEHLSDAYLLEIAQYFAAQDLPYPAPPPSTASPAVMARGEALVRQGNAQAKVPACVQCHGPALTGMLPATPGLLGLSRDYLNGQLGSWRTQHRRASAPDCMAKITGALALEDISAVSSWLSAQVVPQIAHPAAAPTTPLPLPCGSALP